MKTRRKILKSPTKGRRSSIICVKKSPIVRRNPRRNTRSQNKSCQILEYESPLKHLNSDGSAENSPSTSRYSNKSKGGMVVKKENEEMENDISDLSLSLENKNTVETNPDMDINFANCSISSKCKKRRRSNLLRSGDTLSAKKKKLKKSPLSRINETRDCNKLSESVILVDDLDSEPIKTEVLKESVECPARIDEKVNTVLTNPIIGPGIDSMIKNNVTESKINDVNTETKKENSEDIVVIDCNDSSLMEMEAYHDTFNQSTNLPTNASFSDSIIVIDQDDESRDQRRSITPKSNEDCFVVWSSLPKPCTSNSNSILNPQSRPLDLHADYIPISINPKPLLNTKILLDKTANLGNLKFLNNENYKPTKKRVVPKNNTKRMKTELQRYDTIRTGKKFITKTTGKAISKGTAKTVTSTVTSNLHKRKAKNAGELIFLSESKEENETAAKRKSKKGKLREIVIDGNNVAMAYTNNKTFSEKGIKMLIDYFTKKGHSMKVFIPQYRRSRNFPLLEKWYNDGIVVFTPSRKLGNKSFTPYDDRYILEYATACNGIVVSQDQFRDLYAEKPQYRDTIENRLLVPTFVGDYVMFPEDPLGRNGPTLTEFLKH